jgi:hypothetical protein
MMQSGSVNAVSSTGFFYHRLKTFFIPILIEKNLLISGQGFSILNGKESGKEMDPVKTRTKKH